MVVPMEFWGVEVKGGETLKVNPGEGIYLHLSQAALGEVKGKVNNSVSLFVNINDQKLVIGMLSAENCPHISYDVVFEKEFELSHNWTNGSVYFSGYRSVREDSDSEEVPVTTQENGKPLAKKEQFPAGNNNVAKPASSTAQPKKGDNSKEDDDDDDDDSDDSLDDDDEDDSEDEEDDVLNKLMVASHESSDEEDESSDDDNDDGDNDESSDEEDEPVPKKNESRKKRPAESPKDSAKKKAKLVTPQKTGGDSKKGGVHVATPYPSKQDGKALSGSDKSKQQTPKSAGHVSCKSCSKSFNSETALQSHTKAKHGGVK